MRAVAFEKSLPIEEANALIDVDRPKPEPKGRDLLVEIKAVSVNPVDTKVRKNMPPEPGSQKVLGWDAAGIVTAVGPDATLFKPGDAVFYAGAINRDGTNAEFHLVDERIVGPKPASLDFSQAAALPLTTITAWEAMFDRLGAGLKVCVGYRGTRELLFEIGNLFLSREMDHDDHSQEHGHACGGGSCGCSAD